MSNLQMIEELCGIVELQNKIIREQSLRLEELGTVIMQDEIAEASMRVGYMLGAGENPPFVDTLDFSDAEELGTEECK